jgi:hypothetical protein
MQCFGYCIIDQDKLVREQSMNGFGGRKARLVAVNAPVDLIMEDA